MGKKLYTRIDFARLANVSPSTISLACKGKLAAACRGGRIDATHPDAIEFIQKHDPLKTINKPPVKGIDALYYEAVDYANSIGRLSTTSIQTKFSIGYNRAKKIRDLIETAGAFTEPAWDDEPDRRAAELTKIVVTSSQVAEKLTMIQHAQKLLDGGEKPSTEGSILAPEDDGDQLPGLSDFDETGVESLADWTLRAVVLKYGTHERFKGWLLAYKSIVDIGAKEIANAEKRGQLVPRDFVESHIMGHYDRAHINLMTDASQTIARRLIGDIKAGASVEDCEVFVSEQISRHIQEAKASIERALSSV